ncbi:hypothetical protein IKU74_00870 [bacterium]|nr:hypothetical protein [bacterium]
MTVKAVNDVCKVTKSTNSGTPELSKSRTLEIKFQSGQVVKEPKEIAQQLFDDISGLGTSKAIESHLSQLTKDNIIQVLEQYKAISKSQGEEESLLKAIYGEMWGSRSTPKKYAEMIFNKLYEKSAELGVKNNVLKEKQLEELNALSSQFAVNLGLADCSNVEFFVDEIVKRIGIRNTLLEAHSKKVDEAGDDVFANEATVASLENICEMSEVNSIDILGNGKLDGDLKQVHENCWALATLNAFSANPEIKESIENMLYKKDGVVSFYLAEAGEVYSLTEKELVKATEEGYVLGDGDAVAILSAVDKYFKSIGDEDCQDSKNSSNTIDRMFELLLGDYCHRESFTLSDIQSGEFVRTYNVSANTIIQMADKISKGEPYAGVFTFSEDLEVEKISAYDALAEPETIKVFPSHVYSFFASDEQYYYFKDSNDPASYIRMPYQSLNSAFDAAIYRYR